MIIIFKDVNNCSLATNAVQQRRLEDWPHQVPKGMAYWLEGNVDVQEDGCIAYVWLYHQERMLMHAGYSELQSRGCAGTQQVKRGCSFQLKLPVFWTWVTSHGVQQLAELSAPPTVRSATRYRTPMRERTVLCPCGIHHSQCNIHDDWLSVE